MIEDGLRRRKVPAAHGEWGHKLDREWTAAPRRRMNADASAGNSPPERSGLRLLTPSGARH
jgi:hypothetical protein